MKDANSAPYWVLPQIERSQCTEENVSWVLEDLKNSGISEDTIENLNLQIYEGKPEQVLDVLGYNKDTNTTIEGNPFYTIKYPNDTIRAKFKDKLPGGGTYRSRKNAGKQLYAINKDEFLKAKSGKYHLLICEGEKKTIKVTQESDKNKYCIIGISGVTMWEGCEEWKHIKLSGTKVTIFFDNDFDKNESVCKQMIKFFFWLRKMGSQVEIGTWDSPEKGIDDHLTKQVNPKEELEEILKNASSKKFFQLVPHTTIHTNKVVTLLYDIFKNETIVMTQCIQTGFHQKNAHEITPQTLKKLLKQHKNYTINKQKNDNEIFIEGGDLHEIIDTIGEYLNGKRFGIYQRNGLIVTIDQKESANSHLEIKETKQPIYYIKQVELANMQYLLTMIFNFKKYNNQTNQYKNVDCPDLIAKIFLDRGSKYLPNLIGIIYCPTFRIDNTLIYKPGYDEITGLYLVEDIDWAKEGESVKNGFKHRLFSNGTPGYVSKQDAIKSLNFIRNIISEFPFVERVDESVHIACMMTAVTRNSYDSAMMFVYTAPTPGSGKSLLGRMASLILTGREPELYNQPDGKESSMEEEKKLLSILMKNPQCCIIDNLSKPLYSNALCSILTQSEWSSRFLGKNLNITVRTNSITFTVSGNNVVLAGDLSRRALICNIDAKMERPDERTFQIKDIVRYIKENRTDIILHILTIVQGYICAGMPKMNIPHLDGFKDWSKFIRNTLVWLEGEDFDPYLSRNRVEEADPVRNDFICFANAWYNLIEDKEMSVIEIDKKIIKPIMDLEKNGTGTDNPIHMQQLAKVEEFYAACEAIYAFNRGKIEYKKVGRYIAKNKNRPMNNFKFVQGSRSKNGHRWVLYREKPFGEKLANFAFAWFSFFGTTCRYFKDVKNTLIETKQDIIEKLKNDINLSNREIINRDLIEKFKTAFLDIAPNSEQKISWEKMLEIINKNQNQENSKFEETTKYAFIVDDMGRIGVVVS